MVLGFSDLPECSFLSLPATPTLTADPRPLNTSSPELRVTNTTLEGVREEEGGSAPETPGPRGSEGGPEPSRETGEIWGIYKSRGPAVLVVIFNVVWCTAASHSFDCCGCRG